MPYVSIHMVAIDMETEVIFPVVLAGGQSSRMGQDKCFLKLNGEFLIDRAVRVSSKTLKLNPNQVLISGKIAGYRCIEDKFDNLGPIAGIFTIIEHLLKTKNPPVWLLFVPIDMPHLRDDQVNILVNSIVKSVESNDFDAYIFEGFELPLILRCDERVCNIVNDVLLSANRSKRSIHQLLSLIRVHLNPIRDAESDCFLNTNTPDQWLEYLEGRNK